MSTNNLLIPTPKQPHEYACSEITDTQGLEKLQAILKKVGMPSDPSKINPDDMYGLLVQCAVMSGLLSKCPVCEFLFVTSHGCDVCQHAKRHYIDAIFGFDLGKWMKVYLRGEKDIDDTVHTFRKERSQLLSQILLAPHGTTLIPEADMTVLLSPDSNLYPYIDTHLPDIDDDDAEWLNGEFHRKRVGICPACNFIGFVGSGCDVCASGWLAGATEDDKHKKLQQRANLISAMLFDGCVAADTLWMQGIISGIRGVMSRFDISSEDMDAKLTQRETPAPR